MTGAGNIDLGTKMMAFRVEPKLVMTTEGQGRANDPVGFGIPVMIEGPWGAPKIYPDMQGILDNPDAAYAKLKEMGKGLFGPNGGGLDKVLGGLLGGGLQGQQGAPGGQGAAGGQGGKPGDPLGGQLGEAIGNLLQQGLGGLGQGQGQGGAGQRAGPAAPRPNSQRSIPIPGQPADAEPAAPAAPSAQGDSPQADSQPMNEVLRQLFNR
jgi:AsmA protein